MDINYKTQPAVRKGNIYCSPWCGFNCTWGAHEFAVNESARLAKLLGPEWTPKVWENTGWNFRVKNGLLEMRVTGGPSRLNLNPTGRKFSYSVWCQSSPQIIGDLFATPEAAMRDLGRKMEATLSGQLLAFRNLAVAYKNAMPAGRLPATMLALAEVSVGK